MSPTWKTISKSKRGSANTYFGKEDCINCGIVLEVLQYAHSLGLRRTAMDVELVQPLRISLQARVSNSLYNQVELLALRA